MPKSLHDKATKLGASVFGHSTKPGKRFFVLYKGKRIDFGSSTGETYFDHRDKDKRAAWYARHSKIEDKSGKKVINERNGTAFWLCDSPTDYHVAPFSPSYWAARILW